MDLGIGERAHFMSPRGDDPDGLAFPEQGHPHDCPGAEPLDGSGSSRFAFGVCRLRQCVEHVDWPAVGYRPSEPDTGGKLRDWARRLDTLGEGRRRATMGRKPDRAILIKE